MMLAKLPTPVFLKIEEFLNKGCYYVKMFVCDITSKMLSLGSNNIVEFLIRPKFGNCISMRESIITSSL